MSAPPRISVVTTSRADFGIYQPVLAAFAADGRFDVGLIVTGMHLSPEFGLTVADVEASGYPIRDRFEMLLSSDSEEGVAKSMGLGTFAAARSFAHDTPDLLIVLGDRFEMHAVALAALPFRIPVAHIHGGEETEGAIDNALRHSITKLAHLHFCATELAARRIRAMGEPAERVIVSGAPALDHILAVGPMSRAELTEVFGMPEGGDFILATYHPATLDPEGSLAELEALWVALERADIDVVFTLSNADTAGRSVNSRVRDIVESSARAHLVGHMGARGYFSAMRHARAMAGNSSSGVIEAASFALPVVNVGDRQAGRERSGNVIDVEGDTDAIAAGLRKALSDDFRGACAEMGNVYGDGQASARIVDGCARFLETGADVRKSFRLDPS